MMRSGQSQGDCAPKPNVAAWRLRWVGDGNVVQPQRGCGSFACVTSELCENPGLNPVGVGTSRTFPPRVAPGAQPWALLAESRWDSDFSNARDLGNDEGLKVTTTSWWSLRDLGGVAERRGESSRGINPTERVITDVWRRGATREDEGQGNSGNEVFRRRYATHRAVGANRGLKATATFNGRSVTSKGIAKRCGEDNHETNPSAACATSRRRRAQQGGFILVGVLVLVLLASMLVMSLLFSMNGEEASGAAVTGGQQAWLACMSGVDEALRVAAAAKPGATDWRDNPRAFKKQLVFEDGVERWYFTVYSKPDEDSLEPIRYGLTDEASKVNLNTAPRETLARLPGFTQELAEALDQKETNSTVSLPAVPDFSAPPEPPPLDPVPVPVLGVTESKGPEPAAIAGRGFQSLSGLLSVKGFIARTLYGEDANFNLLLDPNEDDGDALPPQDNNDHHLDVGLSGYLTVASYDPNTDNQNARRIDINDPNGSFPKVELPAAVTNYIAALRTNHVKLNHAAELLEAKMKVTDTNGTEVEIASGVSKAELSKVMDLFTASKEPKQEGLINVNTASIKVLTALPGFDEALAESIASARRSTSPERRTTIAWLYEEGTLTADQFKKAAPYLSARSYQYSFHVVGFSLPSGKYRVLEVTIDTANGKKAVTSLRDLTRFGLPIPLEEDANSQEQEQARVGGRRGREIPQDAVVVGRGFRRALIFSLRREPSPKSVDGAAMAPFTLDLTSQGDKWARQESRPTVEGVLNPSSAQILQRSRQFASASLCPTRRSCRIGWRRNPVGVDGVIAILPGVARFTSQPWAFRTESLWDSKRPIKSALRVMRTKVRAPSASDRFSMVCRNQLMPWSMACVQWRTHG